MACGTSGTGGADTDRGLQSVLGSTPVLEVRNAAGYGEVEMGLRDIIDTGEMLLKERVSQVVTGETGPEFDWYLCGSGSGFRAMWFRLVFWLGDEPVIPSPVGRGSPAGDRFGALRAIAVTIWFWLNLVLTTARVAERSER